MLIEILKAILVGGILCVIGQLLIDYTKMTPAKILVTYVVGGVFLSAFGFYQKLIDFGGAGATVPLTGFGHQLAKGVRETIDTRGFFGIFSGGLTAVAGGITIALLSGFIVSAIFKSKAK
jgi:stage V sporulation protein AE